jgi:RNA polymerase sigma-70 factor (ECF subfamily)
MRQGSLSLRSRGPRAEGSETDAPSGRARALLDEHFVFVWRLLRRLGVAENDVDDAVQKVFIVASAKMASITSSSERSFLFGTALRIAASYRRAMRKTHVVDDDAVATLTDPGLMPDEALARHQALALFDRILESMPEDLRVVFVLCEIEELTGLEVAAIQGIPPGTVASRLRRARKEFRDRTQRVLLSAQARSGTHSTR